MKREKTAFSITVIAMLGMTLGFALTQMSAMHSIGMLKIMKIVFVTAMCFGFGLYMLLRTIRFTLVNENWSDGRRDVPSLKAMSWMSMEVGVLSGFWVCVANYCINHPELL